MQKQTVVNDSGFLKYSWAHVAIFNTAAWFLMQCRLRAQRSSTFNWGFLLCPTCTVISLDSLNLFTILCMVLGERPKFFAILHCEMWFLICLTLLSWNLPQSDEPWYLLAKTEILLLYPNMIPWPITIITYNTCLLWTVSKQFNVDIFSLLFRLCPNFFGMCCSRQKQNLFILTKYIYVGQWKLWKSFLCTFVN